MLSVSQYDACNLLPWLLPLWVYFMKYLVSLLLQKQIPLGHLLVHGIKIAYSPNWKSLNRKTISILYYRMKLYEGIS